jgi:hypothetical protein
MSQSGFLDCFRAKFEQQRTGTHQFFIPAKKKNKSFEKKLFLKTRCLHYTSASRVVREAAKPRHKMTA